MFCETLNSSLDSKKNKRSINCPKNLAEQEYYRKKYKELKRRGELPVFYPNLKVDAKRYKKKYDQKKRERWEGNSEQEE